jgi:nitronate monooxygenase
MWEKNPLSKLLGTKYPIIQAPMAAATTPELVTAVSNAGGLGSLGAAMLSLRDLKSQHQSILNKTNQPFNINFFCHPQPERNEQKEGQMRELLAPLFSTAGIPVIPEITTPPPAFCQERLEFSIKSKPAVISFHFGLPNDEFVQALKEAGIKVLSSATCVSEALDLENRGVDAIIAQGFDAGGHRGTYKDFSESGQVGTMSLVPQIVDAVSVPVIAAGGIGDGRGIAAALALGADGVQMGTAFLRCPESACHQLYRDAISRSHDNSTCVTHGFSGKPARALRNKFTEFIAGHEKQLPQFPIPRSLTIPLSASSIKDGNSDFMSLWCGQASALSTDLPAGTLIETLAKDAVVALHRML